MTEKVFKSISEQIELLKSKNLKFVDEVTAAQNLSNFGYYEIINGYRTTFLDLNSTEECRFKDGTTFEDIFALYYFDSKLRTAILGPLDYAENNLKQKLAYILAENYGLDFTDYISEKVFDTTGDKLPHPDKRKKLFNSRDLFFYEMKKIKNRNVHPIKHYRENHDGQIPPWILVKGMSFGNLRTAITLLNSNDKTLLIQRLYSQEVLRDLTDVELKQLLHDTVRAVRNYRNRAAHGTRLYNFFPKKGFSYNKVLHEKVKLSKTSIAKKKVEVSSIHLMMTSLSLWENKFPIATFKSNINSLLTGYATNWDKQIPLILKEMQMPEEFINYKKPK
ncbi:Abi family protein [Lactococcus garvieae]|uniref:Abi family protein n=1 Tax=Lactococcus garvieae TaxID=1363 RepID=UPI001CE32270|nr:Abi family protein [Lactococcus garvieae]